MPLPPPRLPVASCPSPPLPPISVGVDTGAKVGGVEKISAMMRQWEARIKAAYAEGRAVAPG